MYESHFQFERRPFAATPDANCLFITEGIREILAEFVVCAERGQGIGVLTGAAGMGKTLLCQRLADELSASFQVALLKNANFSTRRSLLQSLLFELDQPYAGMSEQELRLELEKYCEQELSGREAIALIIDEAHLMSERLLEEVRCVTNLTAGGVPLVRAILCGQPTLEETLARPGMAALNQRIASQQHLEPLSRTESMQYIEYRVNWAGANPQQIFTDDAIAAIAQAADGVPRGLNQLCDHSLLLAYVSDVPCVGVDFVDEALEDLRQLPLHWNERARVAGPLDALSQIRTEAAAAAETVEETEPYDFDAFSSDGVESIEIGGEEAAAEQSAAVMQGDEEMEYPIVDEDETSFMDMETETENVVEMEVEETDAAADAAAADAEKMEAVQAVIQTINAGISAGVVPLMDERHTGWGIFEEELVEDRYASLDAQRRVRPALSLTHFAAETAAESDVVEPVTAPAGEAPVEPADELVAAEPTAAQIAETIEQMVPSREVAAESGQDDAVEPTEEELGAAILNDCLKAHKSIIDQINRLNFGDEVPEQPGAEGYDVVELESSDTSRKLRRDPQPVTNEQTPTDDAENNGVPRPNLRRLFTKLRRVHHERTGR